MAKNAIVALLIVSSASITGCVGGFRNDASFQRYVANLRLEEMNVASAASRLEADGFQCEANTDPTLHPLPSTYCRKTYGGTRSYQVWLMPSSGDPGKSNVEASVSLVVA